MEHVNHGSYIHPLSSVVICEGKTCTWGKSITVMSEAHMASSPACTSNDWTHGYEQISCHWRFIHSGHSAPSRSYSWGKNNARRSLWMHFESYLRSLKQAHFNLLTAGFLPEIFYQICWGPTLSVTQFHPLNFIWFSSLFSHLPTFLLFHKARGDALFLFADVTLPTCTVISHTCIFPFSLYVIFLYILS